MGDRVISRRYVKLYESWFTTMSHSEFSPATHGIGIQLLLLANRGTQDGMTQWMTSPNGDPFDASSLAKRCRTRLSDMRTHLEALVEAGTIVVREDGCYGFPNFEEWQQPTANEVISAAGHRRSGSVYLIVAGDRVKIGYSANPWARLKELQTGSSVPMTLVAAWAGTREEEAALHRQFSSQRIHGEWFHSLGDVAAFVAARSTTNSPIVATKRSRRRTTAVATNPSASPFPPSVSLLEPPFHSPPNPTTTPISTPTSWPHAANEPLWLESPAEAKSCEPTATDLLVAHVLAELKAACKTLDPHANGPRDTKGNRQLIARIQASESPTHEQWSTVIRRQLASVRGRPDTHKYLSLSTLCVPRNFSRLLDAPGGRGTGGAPRSKAWAPSDFTDETEAP